MRLAARGVLSIAAISAACGRVGFDATDAARIADHDAAEPDASDACARFGAWSPPMRVPELSSPATDWGPSLSRDGRELVFASDRSGNMKLYHALRAGPAAAWSAPTVFAEIPNGAEDPSLSSDRLELYWGASDGVDHARRATLDSPWTELTAILPDTAGYTDPGGPDISRDGLSLVFTATSTSDDLWHEEVTGRATPADNFGQGLLMTSVTSPDGDAFGSLRGDGLEILFESEASPTHLYAATRTSGAGGGGGFGSATLVTELDSPADDADPDLSDDGRTLWFASDRDGGAGWDLYTSTRSCE